MRQAVAQLGLVVGRRRSRSSSRSASGSRPASRAASSTIRLRSRASSTRRPDGVVLVGVADGGATVRGFACPPTMIGGRGCWSGFGQTPSASRPVADDLGELPVELVEPLPLRREREAVGLVLRLEPAGAEPELDAPVRDVVDGHDHLREHLGTAGT